MNSEEGTSLAKMAVSVLLVVLVIGAVVAVVYAAYSWFNSGTSKLGDQVTSIDKSSYSQYDDTTVSGTDVLSALKSYRSSEVGIFIANNNINSGTAYYSDPSQQSQVFTKNYCALGTGIGNTSGSGAPVAVLSTTYDYDLTVTYDTVDGRWEIGAILYDTASNSAFTNTNFSPTTQANNPSCYVKQSAKWYANLVYSEETGDVCGILFRQMN